MRCRSCNTVLSDFEATRKSQTTGEYLDLCNHCFSPVRACIEVHERYDLIETEDCEDFDNIEELDFDEDQE